MTALVSMVAEAPGANCAAGGTKVSVGLDANSNGVLDNGEISGSPSYVCGGLPGAPGANGSNGVDGTNGINGTNGVDGINGTNGVDGINGTNGTNGLNSLMAMTPETAGVNCRYGGTKVTSGLDANGNSALDSTEVSATSYNCNGAPGAGITWVDVTSTTPLTASSGVGYLADASAQVSIALPTSPTVGDLIEVSGVGTGGWKITQNSTQSIITKGLLATYPTYAAAPTPWSTWTPRAGTANWATVTSSADGMTMYAAILNAGVYASTNGGANWTTLANAANGVWRGLATSSDGHKIVGVMQSGQIYTSTDSGAHWTFRRNSGEQFVSVASSADGSTLVATPVHGTLYVSTDSGATWTLRDSVRSWQAVASSSDGTKWVAVAASDQIYTSTDSGTTWTPHESSRNWRAVASSADGNKLLALDANGLIYTSTDAGVNWTSHAGPGTQDWVAATSSADGSKLAALVYGGQVYTSNDSGSTWTAQTGPGNHYWLGATMSADGSRLAAASDGASRLWTSMLTFNDRTTPTTGYLSGSQYDAIKLQYIGGGLWLPLSATSYSGGFTVY